MTDTKTIKLESSNFKDTINSGITLVDFWAEWCMPCRMQGPVLDKLASKIGDKAKIAKLNVDNNPDIAQSFGVMSIPTLILFKDGQPVRQMVGLQTEQALQIAIESAM